VAGGALATVTFLGTMALQDDNGGSNQRPIEESPIVYSGGYGLFPVGE
jgi:hypothetical protein